MQTNGDWIWDVSEVMSCLFAWGLVGWDYDHHRWCHLRPQAGSGQGWGCQWCSLWLYPPVAAAATWQVAAAFPGSAAAACLGSDSEQTSGKSETTDAQSFPILEWRWVRDACKFFLDLTWFFVALTPIFGELYAGISGFHSHYHCDFRRWTMSLNKLLQATSTSHQYQG